MLNLKSRGPASFAVKVTRTVVDCPSAGSVTSCELTMRPSSSTWSGTVVPAYPVCEMTTSTASEVPLSVERGVSTRVIWMSRREVILADADREHRNLSGP